MKTMTKPRLKNQKKIKLKKYKIPVQMFLCNKENEETFSNGPKGPALYFGYITYSLTDSLTPTEKCES